MTSTLENGAALKVATIAVTDDMVGTNVVSLMGADAGSFSIQNGNELWFNGGANFEAKASYAVTVAVDDAAMGATPDASQNFSLAITNVVGNSIVAKNGGQTLTGTIEEDTLTGGNGKDVLIGGGGNDVLLAGKGVDVLNGGAGNDTMDGGEGSDVFIFAAGFGNDRVLGFDADPKGGQDLMDISAFGITGATFAARVTIASDGANTRVTIDHDAAQTILLVGIADSTAVTQADFLI